VRRGTRSSSPSRAPTERQEVAIAAIAIRVLAFAVILATMPRVNAVTFPGANGKIAFASFRDGNYEIYAINAHGTGQNNLTNNPAAPAPPVANLTFQEVTEEGDTFLTIRAAGPPPPYFDFTTTAEFEGTITVCIDYSALVVHDPASLKLCHYEPSSLTPVDSTVSNDPVSKIICGLVTSLSPSAALEPEPPAIQPCAGLSVSATTDPSQGDFVVRGTFTLGPNSDGIDVRSEDVLVQVGPFTATIPAGAFRRHGAGRDCHFNGHAWGTRWRRPLARRFGPPRGFEARMQGVHPEAHLRPLGRGRYAFEIRGRDADLEGIANPVTVGILIGNDGGSTQVTARCPPPRDRWRGGWGDR
jgi:hypothetical protein